jgi:hypothetical protein
MISAAINAAVESRVFLGMNGVKYSSDRFAALVVSSRAMVPNADQWGCSNHRGE